jgi:hypothetical protein
LNQGMTGYDTHDRYYATRYDQGCRTVYSIDLSLTGVASTLPRPDANRPTPGNRRVNLKHAQGFGDYVRQHENWVAPALLLRAPEIFEFKPEKQVGGTEFGILSLPRLARADLRILDGQHRILGLHLATDDIARDLEDVRNHLATARRNGDAGVVKHYEAKLTELEEQRRRLSQERISIQIHVEDQQTEFEQMFVDIADNALGIPSAIRTRFDDRKVVNRALDDVLKHALLWERVDMEQDRISGASPYLMGAKHVADIIRTLTVGLSGRVGRRQEEELREAALVERANAFFDMLTESFAQFEDLVEGNSVPEQLRRTSLLGSITMLRVFSGVYHELLKELDEDEIKDFFAKLSKHMNAPVEKTSPWLAVGVFSENGMAPRARGHDQQQLARAIRGWALNSPAWLK